MPKMAKKEAFHLLLEAKSLNFDELDDIFKAFDFDSEASMDGTIWYEHAEFPICGRFPAHPDYDQSLVLGEQRALAAGMIRCVRYRRHLGGIDD